MIYSGGFPLGGCGIGIGIAEHRSQYCSNKVLGRGNQGGLLEFAQEKLLQVGFKLYGDTWHMVVCTHDSSRMSFGIGIGFTAPVFRFLTLVYHIMSTMSS